MRWTFFALLFACGPAAVSSVPPSDVVQTAATRYEPSSINAAPADDSVERVRVPIGDAPIRGVGQLVTIVQFTDFQCPFCGRVVPTLERLLERYPAEVRVVFRHYPLPFHAHAEPAAMAALEVRSQLGDLGFWRFHDHLFANPDRLGVDDLVAAATQLGADGSAVRSAIRQHSHLDALNRDRESAARVRVTGTPAHFLNGRPIMGAQPYAAFARVVEEEIALARQRNAEPTTWYDTLLAGQAAERRAPPPRRAAPDTTVFDVPIGNSPQQGSDDALISLVVFTDFQCPFCARALPTLASLQEQLGTDLRIVFRHFPLPFHRDAMGAHEAAQEAFAQGGHDAFWTMHDLLFANRRALVPADLERYAAEAGLDVPRFRQAMLDHRHRALVESDMELGRSVGIRGTPSFFLNGRKLVGAQPLEAFTALADEVGQAARAELASGTSPAELYATIIEEGQRQQPSTVVPDQLPSAPPIPAHAPRRGAGNAAVTIQIFSDFQCPYCGRLNPAVERALEQYAGRVQVVFRHMPLRNHQHARLAAEASIEVRHQAGDEAFWRFHDLLFANQGALTREDLERYAAQVGGVDLGSFRRALDHHSHASVIAADQRAARVVGVRGTPTLVIGRHILRGARPFIELEELLDRVLDE